MVQGTIMPYSDSNPERRNLTVLSLAIIVYYLAGGEFLNNEVKLVIINAKFNNPSVLIAFVWVMLCWFLFRYFVTQKKQGQVFHCAHNERPDPHCLLTVVSFHALAWECIQSQLPDRVGSHAGA